MTAEIEGSQRSDGQPARISRRRFRDLSADEKAECALNVLWKMSPLNPANREPSSTTSCELFTFTELDLLRDVYLEQICHAETG